MLSFFPRDVLDEILNLIESVSKGFVYLNFHQSAFVSFHLNVPLRALNQYYYHIIVFMSTFMTEKAQSKKNNVLYMQCTLLYSVYYGYFLLSAIIYGKKINVISVSTH